jgi:hypothetical protein
VEAESKRVILLATSERAVVRHRHLEPWGETRSAPTLVPGRGDRVFHVLWSSDPHAGRLEVRKNRISIARSSPTLQVRTTFDAKT